MEAYFPKEELSKHIGLVRHIVNKYVTLNDQRHEEYMSCGMLGLVKAYNSFDWDRNIKFSTYATTCILNEVRMELRRNKKSKPAYLEEVVASDDSKELRLIDTIPVMQDYTQDQVMKFANTLNDRYKVILRMTIAGFQQQEIADYLNLSQSVISRHLSDLAKKYIAFIGSSEGLETRRRNTFRKKTKEA